jgi:hypothetical protein
MIKDFMRYLNGNLFIERTGFKITNSLIRFSDIPSPKFPDVIEIKITNKCIYNCLGCKSKENGVNNFNHEVIYTKLNELPQLPLMFLISGGNILESLEGLYEITKFLKNRFQGCTIMIKLNSLSIERIGNLSHCSFGRNVVQNFLYDVDFYSISLNQLYDPTFIEDRFFKQDGLGRISGGDNIIFRVDCKNQKLPEILERNNKRKNNIFLLSGPTKGNKKYLQEFIEERKYHFSNPEIYFDEISREELELGSEYSLGWNNYIFYDTCD